MLEREDSRQVESMLLNLGFSTKELNAANTSEPKLVAFKARFKSAFRRLSKCLHPDQGGDPERFRLLLVLKKHIEDLVVVPEASILPKQRVVVIHYYQETNGKARTRVDSALAATMMRPHLKTSLVR